MNIHLFQLGLLGTNCYLLQKDGEALVIDPGGDPQQSYRRCRRTT